MSDMTIGSITFGPNLVPDADGPSGDQLALPTIQQQKSPYDMTIAELQAAIGLLQSILHFKVCGDPRERVTVRMGQIGPTMRERQQIERCEITGVPCCPGCYCASVLGLPTSENEAAK